MKYIWDEKKIRNHLPRGSKASAQDAELQRGEGFHQAGTFELDHVSTTRKIRVVRKEGQRNVARRIDFYNLDMIISIGYRVNSKTGVRFRRWANQVLKDYMLKGYAINQHKIATDLQIADHLQEQRQLIEKQNAEIENVKRDVAEQDSRLSAVEKHIEKLSQKFRKV